jgi:hypothetical protein
VFVTDEADGDEGGEGVTDDSDVEETEPAGGAGGEFERELGDHGPGGRTEISGEGSHGEDGYEEGVVAAVAGAEGLGDGSVRRER